MGPGLGLCGSASGAEQLLCGIGISRFAALQGQTGFLGDECLGPPLLLQVFDLLGTSEQAGLLGVRSIEADAVAPHRMAAADQQKLT